MRTWLAAEWPAVVLIITLLICIGVIGGIEHGTLWGR